MDSLVKRAQNNIKVSIIVPIYNAEKTIKCMLDSLQAQTMSSFEVIIIDDGSTDNSPNICDEYVKKDSRFRVIHQPNAGVAMSRQIGINNAHGEYSIHADADDWIEPTMLEEMYNQAKKENADIVITDYFINNSRMWMKENICIQKPSSTNSSQVLIDILKNKLFGALWNKLLRTKLYQKYNVKFFYGINYCEDVLIWAQILKHENIKICYLNKPYYHYSINPDSITHRFNRKSYETRRAFAIKLNEILTNYKYNQAKQIANLGIFTEGFINNCLTKTEIKEEFKKNAHTAFHETKSLRWKLGYLMIKLRLYTIAHKLIQY